MVALSGRCAREARLLACRNSSLPRSRSFHSSVTLRDDSNASNNGNSPLKTTLANQATFDAVKSAASQPSLIRFTDAGGAAIQDRIAGKGPRVSDVRSLGAKAGSGYVTRIAVRRPPPAPGASPSGNRPRAEHGTDLPATPGRNFQRSPAAGRSSRGFGGRKGGAKGKGKGGPKRAKKADAEEKKEKISVYTYADFIAGRPLPKDHDMSDAEIEYLVQQAEQEAKGASFVPVVTAKALSGNGATTVTGPRDSSELMHKLFSRSASVLQPTNHEWPAMKAHQLLHGQTVYFHSEEEARAVQDHTKSMRFNDLTNDITNRKPGEQLPKNKSFGVSSFEDIKLETVPEADRARVNGAWLSGKYVTPGEGAGKNATAVMKDVWRQTARNPTYLAEDEKSLAKKVASLVPRGVPAGMLKRGAAKPVAQAATT